MELVEVMKYTDEIGTVTVLQPEIKDEDAIRRALDDMYHIEMCIAKKALKETIA